MCYSCIFMALSGWLDITLVRVGALHLRIKFISYYKMTLCSRSHKTEILAKPYRMMNLLASWNYTVLGVPHAQIQPIVHKT